MSLRRPSQNPAALFAWSQGNKGSSLYSSKRSLLPDHLMDAREVLPACWADSQTCRESRTVNSPWCFRQEYLS